MYRIYLVLLDCYFIRKNGCSLHNALASFFVRHYAFIAPQILELHVKPPGYMVILPFCNVPINSNLSRIFVGCIRNDGFNVTWMDYSGSSGLGLALSTQPHALFDWLKLSGLVLVATTARVRWFMGDCWILHQGVSSRVAPSEQPKPGHQCFSPPPIRRSMMHTINSETPLIFELVACCPLSFCHALLPFWAHCMCSCYIIYENHWTKLLCLLDQEMWH